MKPLTLALLLVNTAVINASVGDQLPEFQQCLVDCDHTFHCDSSNIFEKIEMQRLASDEGKYLNNAKRNRAQFLRDDFDKVGDVNFLSRTLFRWTCQADCDYKCQQIISKQRQQQGDPMVKFHGKWPFVRVLGITEFASTVFSIGNFMVNWKNLDKILKQRNKNKKYNQDLSCMYNQYLLLLFVSLVGWTFSTIFHIRDNAITETLDYYGAALIIICNFNAVAIRYFELFKHERRLFRRLFQLLLGAIWIGHMIRLKVNWNYDYNAVFNMIFGVLAMALWCLLSLRTNAKYNSNYVVYNNSIQLLPFETKILTKLNYLGFRVSKSKFIPLIPIALNLCIIIGIGFELFEFKPWHSLVDAHALWHLVTIFPPIFWYDWNIWDLELYNIKISY